MKGSASLLLLQQIRDEAHRFAVNYGRKLMGKKMKKSFLDDIDFIGEKRKKEILRHFKTVGNLKKASKDKIKKVKGIYEKIAEKIYKHING